MANVKKERIAETPPAKSKKEGGESKITETTLGKLGPNLPLGIEYGGTMNKGFTVRPWRMKEEKALARAKQADPGQNLATYVSTVVAYMCPQLGPHTLDFTGVENTDDKALAERRVHVSQMYMCDVWYAYAYIRREALGSVLNLKIACPRCRKQFPWKGDLSTLTVKTAPDLEACDWKYKLNDPINIRGKKITSFRMGPQRWQVAESIYNDPNEGQAKEATIRASVYYLNDETERAMLLSNDLDELTKLDIEGLAADIDLNYIGPNMSIELGKDMPCPHCGYNDPRLIGIDWSFDSFFGVSSH